MLLPLEYGFTPPWNAAAPPNTGSFPALPLNFTLPTPGDRENLDGGQRSIIAQFRQTSPYPAGGYRLFAGFFGMVSIHFVSTVPSNSFAGLYQYAYDIALKSLRMFYNATGFEVLNGYQDSNATANLLVIGE